MKSIQETNAPQNTPVTQSTCSFLAKDCDLIDKEVESFLSELLHEVEYQVSGEYSEAQSTCSSLKIAPYNEKTFQVDNRLLNWQKWLNKRRQDSERISKKINRKKHELLINYNANCLRKTLDRIDLIEKAGKYHLRKLGADTVFWMQPEKLKDLDGRGDCFLTLKKSEKMRKPQIQNVQTPKLILEESNINWRDFRSRRKLLDSVYYKEKKNKLRWEIGRIQPFSPEMSDLALKGHHYDKNIKQKSAPIFNKEEDLFEPPATIVEILPPSQILEINGQILNLHEPSRKLSTIDLTFRAFKFEKKISYMSLKNHGLVALNLLWKLKPAKDCNLDQFITRKKHNILFFNKFLFRIVPDQEILFPVYFHSSEIGVFTENWILEVDPPFSEENSISLNLVGSCSKKYSNEDKLRMFHHRILSKAAQQSVEQIINNIFKTSFPKLKPADPRLFCNSKEEKFTTKNPNLFYQPGAVEILMKVHEQISPTSTWDYDVQKLYDLVLEVEDLTKKQLLFEQMKQSIKEFMFPPINLQNIPKKKELLVQDCLSSWLYNLAEEAFQLENLQYFTEHDLLYHKDPARCPNFEKYTFVKSRNILANRRGEFSKALEICISKNLLLALDEVVGILEA